MLHDYLDELDTQIEATIATARETITLNTGGRNLLAYLKREGYAIVKPGEVQPIPDAPLAPEGQAQG